MLVTVDMICLACALVSSSSFGFWASRDLLCRITEAKRKKALRANTSQSVNYRKTFLSHGLVAWVIDTAQRQSQHATVSAQSKQKRFSAPAISKELEQRILLAGMKGKLSAQGVHQSRLVCLVTFAAVLCVCGMMVSIQLSVIGAVVGVVFGWWAIDWALSREAQARKQSLESFLSEAVEVICLGLRSGLSFDYALQMYCDQFDTVLSSELALARNEWMAGLKARDQALRDVASGYDSSIFSRVVESIVRAIRFGSPLADVLESLAVEARQAHKADVEEKVMKAPVKMMLPVGTLILPSMLIFVLGPVLLDLVKGF